jgi:hypothetical protein
MVVGMAGGLGGTGMTRERKRTRRRRSVVVVGLQGRSKTGKGGE